MPDPKPPASDDGDAVSGSQFPTADKPDMVLCLEGHQNFIKYDPDTLQTYRCWDCDCLFSV